MTTRPFPYARHRDEFRRMWTDGASYREIQAAFGVAKGTVGSWRYRLGLPPRHWTRQFNRTTEQNRQGVVICYVAPKPYRYGFATFTVSDAADRYLANPQYSYGLKVAASSLVWC